MVARKEYLRSSSICQLVVGLRCLFEHLGFKPPKYTGNQIAICFSTPPGDLEGDKNFGRTGKQRGLGPSASSV